MTREEVERVEEEEDEEEEDYMLPDFRLSQTSRTTDAFTSPQSVRMAPPLPESTDVSNGLKEDRHVREEEEPSSSEEEEEEEIPVPSLKWARMEAKIAKTDNDLWWPAKVLTHMEIITTRGLSKYLPLKPDTQVVEWLGVQWGYRLTLIENSRVNLRQYGLKEWMSLKDQVIEIIGGNSKRKKRTLADDFREAVECADKAIEKNEEGRQYLADLEEKAEGKEEEEEEEGEKSESEGEGNTIQGNLLTKERKYKNEYLRAGDEVEYKSNFVSGDEEVDGQIRKAVVANVNKVDQLIRLDTDEVLMCSGARVDYVRKIFDFQRKKPVVKDIGKRRGTWKKVTDFRLVNGVLADGHKDKGAGVKQAKNLFQEVHDKVKEELGAFEASQLVNPSKKRGRHDNAVVEEDKKVLSAKKKKNVK